MRQRAGEIVPSEAEDAKAREAEQRRHAPRKGCVVEAEADDPASVARHTNPRAGAWIVTLPATQDGVAGVRGRLEIEKEMSITSPECMFMRSSYN